MEDSGEHDEIIYANGNTAPVNEEHLTLGSTEQVVVKRWEKLVLRADNLEHKLRKAEDWYSQQSGESDTPEVRQNYARLTNW